ncbi:hypothetical protein ACB092_11G158200 [Castanea dentata]
MRDAKCTVSEIHAFKFSLFTSVGMLYAVDDNDIQTISKCESKVEINSSTSNHAIFMSLNPLLLALLQVDYQTHPTNVWGFLAGTCLYFMALALKRNIDTRWASCSHILGHVLLISGAFSSFSLVSIFLPRSPGWLPFIIFPFMIAHPLLVHVYHWLFHVILKVTPQIGNFFGRLMGSITVQQQQLPN